MKIRLIPSSAPCRRGTTLVEVVAGLAVLGVLIASAATARARFSRQWAEAQRKLSAADAVDRMVAGWFDGGRDLIPVNARGNLEGLESMTWRTSIRRDEAAESLESAIVRLDVYDGPRRIISLDLLKHVDPLKAEPSP